MLFELDDPQNYDASALLVALPNPAVGKDLRRPPNSCTVTEFLVDALSIANNLSDRAA
jgi:hypothetical protein